MLLYVMQLSYLAFEHLGSYFLVLLSKLYQSGFSREIEKIGYMSVYVSVFLSFSSLSLSPSVSLTFTQGETGYMELTCAIMESKESHNLPSSSQRDMKVCDIIQWESEGLNTRNTKGRILISWLNLSVSKPNSSFLCLLVLFRPTADWEIHTHIGECKLLYKVHQCKC